MKLYKGIKSKYSDHVEVDCEATLSDLRKAASELGMVVVPREPTAAMVKAGSEYRTVRYGTDKIYKAMIEAEGEGND